MVVSTQAGGRAARGNHDGFAAGGTFDFRACARGIDGEFLIAFGAIKNDIHKAPFEIVYGLRIAGLS